MTPPSLHLNFKQRVCVCVTCHDWEGDDFFCPSVFFPLGEGKQLWNLGRRKRDKVVQYFVIFFVHLIKGYFFPGGRRIVHLLGWWTKKSEVLRLTPRIRPGIVLLGGLCLYLHVMLHPMMDQSSVWWTLGSALYLGDAIFSHPTPCSIKANEMIRAMLVGDCIVLTVFHSGAKS